MDELFTLRMQRMKFKFFKSCHKCLEKRIFFFSKKNDKWKILHNIFILLKKLSESMTSVDFIHTYPAKPIPPKANFAPMSGLRFCLAKIGYGTAATS